MSRKSPSTGPGSGHLPDQSWPEGLGRPEQVSLASDLSIRAVSGAVMIVLALATAWSGGQVFILFWLLAGSAVMWEWQRLIRAPGLTARLFIGGGGLAVAASLTAGAFSGFALVAIFAAAAAIALPAGRAKAFWAAGGIVYAGALVVAVLAIRLSLVHGFTAIIWLFALVWGTDILAYFSGRTFGGPKLWPKVSPSKTWSGFVCGVTGGAVVATAVTAWLLPATRPHALWLFCLSLVLAMVSQGGDLFESTVKRHYGVKDASNLIPGHGGAMDRLDGFTMAAICAAIYGAWRGGPLNIASGLFLW